MTLHKTLLAAALAAGGLVAAGSATAQVDTRNQVRAIEREYARLNHGRSIPDAQLEYYLDRSDAGWSLGQISRDIASHSRNRGGWVPQRGWIAREVVCTSIDRRYRECQVPFRGRAVVTHQISDTNCVEGRTWGQRNGRIWVNHGCRARFGIVRNDVARRNDNRRYDNRRNDDLTDRTVVCASNRGAYRECRTGFRGDVYLSRRLNNSSACVEGRTWGQRPGSVWVRGGCRAQFESIGRRGPRDDNRAMGSLFTRDPGYFVTCSSTDGGRSVCNWDNRYGTPRMIERLSRDGCVEGRDWGYNSRGQVWVDSGCRARFGYR